MSIRPKPHPLDRLRAITDLVADIEHTMMVVYLYAALSVRDPFQDLAGYGGSPLPTNLFGIAVEEMQHLHAINRVRKLVGLPPRIAPRTLPEDFGIYPFKLGLQPLSRFSAWKYAYVEAPPEQRNSELLSLGLELMQQDEQSSGLVELANMQGVDTQRPAALYAELNDAFEALGPKLVNSDIKSAWLAKIREVKRQGDDDHFRLFRELALGEHEIFKRKPFAASWGGDDPASQLTRNLTVQKDELIGHLYRLVCALLYVSYLFDGWGDGPDTQYTTATLPFYRCARDVMQRLVLPYGRELAQKNRGLPLQIEGGLHVIGDTRGAWIDQGLELVANALRSAQTVGSTNLDTSVLRKLQLQLQNLRTPDPL